ncbi:MAG: hypothetical protein R3B67_13210 [Phycisphaerales bacterium]
MRDPLPWGDQGNVFDAVTLPAGQGGLDIRVQLKQPSGGYILIDQSSDRAAYLYQAAWHAGRSADHACEFAQRWLQDRLRTGDRAHPMARAS